MDAMAFRTRRLIGLDDLRGHALTGAVVEVTSETPRNRWRPQGPPLAKLVLVFGDGRAVVAEGRNLDALIACFGAETDAWIGRSVTVDVEVVPTASGRGRERKRIRPVAASEGAERRTP